ncbi:MAG: PLP-dependent transferase [Clostridia bacterium]|nr:PLP-dependent transferase [Clostridia bacterium]
MNTPVYDFVKKYSESENIRLHMPGHKGKKGFIDESFDITEIDGADVLYHETGILKISQQNASEIFGTKKTLYSAEGSSLCIRAMLTLIKMQAEKNGKKTVISAVRNAHKVFMTAAALLDIKVNWIYPENSKGLISAQISPEYLDAFLSECEEKPAAIYVTSPDYLGYIADIKGIAEVCKKYGVLLAVDNAHGAYLRFLPENRHPIFLGADICCDSAHKTLPVLTGGAYLHISENAPAEFTHNSEKVMSLFSSTSPSYLILSSLDKANEYLSGDYKKELSVLVEKLNALKEKLKEGGFVLLGDEPLKLTIDTKTLGYKGYEFSDILSENGIVCEFSDPDFIVMMFTPDIKDEELKRIEDVLSTIKKKNPVVSPIPSIPRLIKRITEKEALFSPSEEISANEAVGRILASPSVLCPPAIPIAICGEELSLEAVECFKYYSIEKINVVKEV